LALSPEFSPEPITRGVFETARLQPSLDDHAANLGTPEDPASADFSSVYTFFVHSVWIANWVFTTKFGGLSTDCGIVERKTRRGANIPEWTSPAV
jgi:hypothetical protein